MICATIGTALAVVAIGGGALAFLWWFPEAGP